MKISCLINNYNYSLYLGEAIDSAMSQTVDFDEIIIVDDGSTDDSREKILEKVSQYKKLKYIFKDNGGQMSAFNVGYEQSTGDLICFLDSDDLLKSNYLENTIRFFNKKNNCDYLFCAYEKFGREKSIKLRYPSDRDLGITSVLVTHRKTIYGIGGPTSTLAIRRQFLEKILPYPHFQDWIGCADDVLAFGASLAGAHKYFNSEPLVCYRVHNENNHHGRKLSTIDKLNKDLAANRLVNYYRNKFGYDANLSYLAFQEFKTNPSPDIKLLKTYYRIVCDGVNTWTKRFYFLYKLSLYYIDRKFRASDKSCN